MPLYQKEHQNLTIVEKIGHESPSLKNNTLTIYTYFQDYSNFAKAEISYAENFIMLSMKSNGHYRSYYYVYDYDAWNLRYFTDSSVKYHLEKLQAKYVKFRDRHEFTLEFGRTSDGKASLEALCSLLIKRLPIVIEDDESNVLERPWNQELDILMKQVTTKATFHLTSETLDEFIDEVEKAGFPVQAEDLRGYRAKAMFKQMSGTIDFKPLFVKQKKKPSKKQKEEV